jgi:redox-sensitive bicupin YhaK (pirin superfamily)
VILVAGRPLREPVARYGPFVMNTREELMQAVVDYQQGRF